MIQGGRGVADRGSVLVGGHAGRGAGHVGAGPVLGSVKGLGHSGVLGRGGRGGAVGFGRFGRRCRTPVISC